MKNLWKAIGRPSLAEDPRFDSNPNRIANREALTEIVESWNGNLRFRRAVMEVLEAARVPHGPCLSPTEALTHPHFLERGWFGPCRTRWPESFRFLGFPSRAATPFRQMTTSRLLSASTIERFSLTSSEWRRLSSSSSRLRASSHRSCTEVSPHEHQKEW